MMRNEVLRMSIALRLRKRGKLGFSGSRSSTSLARKGFVLGVMSETYNLWERRAPLCPKHVASLIEEYQPTGELHKIIVQPSNCRVFSNSQYEAAGAIVQEDLTEAHLILGVKRPLREQDLKSEKAYCFFSHVVKGQPENMALLKHVLDNKIELFDYECLVEGGLSSTSRALDQKQKRLVAFGKFAGMAGTNNALHALGRRLLHRGFSTPLLHVPPAYTYSDWDEARRCLSLVGEQIQREFLPLEPLVVCVTGRGGNVHAGALEVLQLLPHKMLSVEDLPSLFENKAPHNHVYILPVAVGDLVEHKSGASFDRHQYQENPHEYVSIFGNRIAKYVSVLVNAAYWSERYPRLLSKAEMHEMYLQEATVPRLQVVADISCDVGGSIEFLHRVTSIERPFFEYDPIRGKEIIDDVSGDGITVSGVDILPSELPKESSEHFGDALLPYMRHIIKSSHGSVSGRVGALIDLPPEIRHACIASDGELTEGFKYIEALMTRQPQRQEQQELSIILLMEGHLFDSGLINESLDAIESHGCHFEIIECDVRRACDGAPRKSKVVLKVSSSDCTILDSVHDKIHTLADTINKAEAVVKRCDGDIPKGRLVSVHEPESSQKILILGSGMVSHSAVEYLGRKSEREIMIVGIGESEARDVARRALNGKHMAFDVANDAKKLQTLIDKADVVVSLLPARFHAMVAEICVDKGTNLVTASYESDAMRALHLRATAAGVTIINEVGLDPGLDHMSAMRIIDKIHARGGTVQRFRSMCGGLPSLSAADNPLRYKFSWNPKGALAACLNDAIYKINGVVRHVDGENLLSSATQFRGPWSEYDLECLPNRDSLVYMKKYGIQSASTCFRGTLRYAGFSSLMDAYRNLGFLTDAPGEFQTWGDILHNLRNRRVGGGSIDDLIVAACHGDHQLARRVSRCSQFLQLASSQPLANPDSVLDSFASLLQAKLSFQPGESDVVLMCHEVVGSFENGATELHSAVLKVDGDDKMSAMCKTVGYTTAIATEMLLRGEILRGGGLLLPTSRHVYAPILDRISNENIVFSENGFRIDKDIRCLNTRVV